MNKVFTTFILVSDGDVCGITATAGQEVTLKETLISAKGRECFWRLSYLATFRCLLF